MAIFVQILSAKLGIATGVHLPDHCGKIFSRPVNWGLWSIATVAAMATDLAEFLGGVLGFYLLFGIPLVWSAVLTGVITYGICHMQKYGQQIVERIITGMVAVISIAYVWEMFISKPDWSQVAYHVAVPMLTPDSVLVAVGMLGATVMPHVIYLHSHLVQTRRTECMEDCKHHLKMAKIDVFFAMNMAFIVNAAMVIVSAAVFNGNGLDVDSIEAAYMTLQPLMGNMAAGAFGLALLASGLSSSTVGTMAGEVILNGFVGFDIPISIRRLITMVPGLAILMSGVNPMDALVYSQVSLEFCLASGDHSLDDCHEQSKHHGEIQKQSAHELCWLDHCQYDSGHERGFDVSYLYRSGLIFTGVGSARFIEGGSLATNLAEFLGGKIRRDLYFQHNRWK